MKLAKHRCAGCEGSIHGTKDDPICCSALYQSGDVTLCKMCQNYEEEEIYTKGTNDIPELVKKYQTPHKFG